MNNTPKRFGKTAGPLESANAENDSSHGRAMVTPAPRSTARREIRGDCGVCSGILFTFHFLGVGPSFVQKLRAGDDYLSQWRKTIVARGQFRFHALDRRLVGEQQRPAEREGQQFAAQIVDEVLLAMVADERLDALETGAGDAAREDRLHVHRVSREVLGSLLADRAVPFKG